MAPQRKLPAFGWLVLCLAAVAGAAPAAASAGDGRRGLQAAARGVPACPSQLKACASQLTNCTAQAASTKKGTGKQLEWCSSSLRVAKAQVTRLSPAASKLAGASKGAAVLAARLSAKTAALNKCTSSGAAMAKQLSKPGQGSVRSSVGAASVQAAAARPSAASGCTSQDSRIAELERQLASTQGQLRATMTELEETYGQLSEAQGQVFADLEQAMAADADSLHACLVSTVEQDAKLANAEEQLSIHQRAASACEVSLAGAEAQADDALRVGAELEAEVGVCLDRAEAAEDSGQKCSNSFEFCSVQRTDLGARLEGCKADYSAALRDAADMGNKLVDHQLASVKVNNDLAECQWELRECGAK